MGSNVIHLKGVFAPVGRTVTRGHSCLFRPVNCAATADAAVKVVLHAAGRTFVDPTPQDARRYAPKPVSGVLEANGLPVPGARVEFVAGNALQAEAVTDAGGVYRAWLPPGVYAYRVAPATTFAGELTVGEHQGLSAPFYYEVAAGLVAYKAGLPGKEDVTAFRGTPFLTVRGRVLDGEGCPVPDALVTLTQGRVLAAHAPVNAKGDYAFAVLPGEYTVRLAAPGAPAKLVRRVVVDGRRGFAEAMVQTGDFNVGRRGLLAASPVTRREG